MVKSNWVSLPMVKRAPNLSMVIGFSPFLSTNVKTGGVSGRGPTVVVVVGAAVVVVVGAAVVGVVVVVLVFGSEVVISDEVVVVEDVVVVGSVVVVVGVVVGSGATEVGVGTTDPVGVNGAEEVTLVGTTMDEEATWRLVEIAGVGTVLVAAAAEVPF